MSARRAMALGVGTGPLQINRMMSVFESGYGQASRLQPGQQGNNQGGFTAAAPAADAEDFQVLFPLLRSSGHATHWAEHKICRGMV